MNIDELEGMNEETRQKIEELLLITREKYEDDKFFEAQYDIAQLLKENEIFKHAHIILRKLEKNAKDVDNFKWQHAAQFDIGAIFLEIGDLKNAIWSWQRTKDMNGEGKDRLSQVLIGKLLRDQGDLEGTEKAWQVAKTLDESSSPKFNSEIRLLIGQVLEEKGDIEGALREWSEIKYENDISRYAKAQFNIGNMFFKQGIKEDALTAWRKVTCKDNPEIYIKAQFNIEKVINHMDIHGKAFKQLGLKNNWILDNKDKIKKAFSEWDVDNSPKDYAYSKLKFGEKIINFSESQDIKNAKIFFDEAKEYYAYESYNYLLICELLSHTKSENLGKLALGLVNKVQEIIDILVIDFSSSFIENKIPERKLAHYTSTDTANKLLNSEDANKLSSLRLNTINNVNDPSEGKLLLSCLRGKKNLSFHKPDFDEKLHAFISCFTFNHDSLNQFRLYGKKENKEASGVSLVFKKYFFQSNSSSITLPFPLFESSIKSSDESNERKIQVRNMKKLSIITSEGDFEPSSVFNIKERIRDYSKVKEQPVMRCVYIDPSSGYIHLAQRNRLTFFREFNKEDDTLIIKLQNGNEESIIWADVEWEKYKFDINKKQVKFKEIFEKLKETYKLFEIEFVKFKEIFSRSDDESYKKTGIDLSSTIDELIDKVLLPLQYLIKHSAFQEEQECRMVYITHLNRPEVKMDFGRFLYVEYEADVKTHLDKIYIAPAATQYQPYLAKLLCDTNVKIELSNNPYRQT